MKTQSRFGVTIPGISPGHVEVTVNDSNTIDFTASGTDNQTITADVKISATGGNIITANADGIYAIASGTGDDWGSQVIEHDALSISSGDGTLADPLLVSLLTSVTYAQLAVLISGSDLIPGHKYLITDYQTVHTIPTTATTNTGPTEPLIVTAVSSNELSPIAYSTLHPDDIIYYNPTNNLTAVPGCTKGYIIKRIDTINNNDIPTDWRYVKYRRYALNVTDVYDIGTTYDKGDVVIDGVGDTIYISLVGSNLGNSLSDVTKWITSSTLINGEYLSPSLTNYPIGNIGIPVNNSDFQDYTLFNGTYVAQNNVVTSSLTYLLTLNTVIRNYLDGDTVSIQNNNLYTFTNCNIIKQLSGVNCGIGGCTINNVSSIHGGAISGSAIKKITNCKLAATNVQSVIAENEIIYCDFTATMFQVLIGNQSAVGVTFKYNVFNSDFREASVLGSFQYNTINCYTVGGDLTAATHIYGAHTIEIFYREGSAVPRLRYTDGSDVITYSAITA